MRKLSRWFHTPASGLLYVHEASPANLSDRHSQFGNMLVLAATYRSHLGYLVEKHNFIRLLDRTISFLRELGAISPTLETDASILSSVRRTIVNEEPVSSSFSSTSR